MYDTICRSYTGRMPSEFDEMLQHKTSRTWAAEIDLRIEYDNGQICYIPIGLNSVPDLLMLRMVAVCQNSVKALN